MKVQNALPLTVTGYQEAEENLIAALRIRSDVCSWLLQQGPWNLFTTTFSETHVAAHQFWQLRDPQHPLWDSKSAQACGDTLENIYRSIDVNLANLLEALPADANVVFMTPQGVSNNYSGSHRLPKWRAMREGRTPQLIST